MHHVIQRLGFRATRGLAVLLLIAGVITAAAFWIGPLRPAPAELHLVALSPDGQFQQVVRMSRALADTFSLDGASVGRYPLLLGVYNNGAKSAEAVQLALSLPAKYRLTNSRGEAYPPRMVPGNPLARYVFDLEPVSIEPGATPRMLPAIDTVWLEPTIPSYYCTTFSDSIPEFVPAPPQNPQLLANVNLFYSFATRSSARQTGILAVHLDPAAVRRDIYAPVNVFPTTIHEPEVKRPQVPALFLVGTRVSQCGDAGYPLQIHSTLYRTREGGRVFVISLNNVVRKYLYDLNRDSIVELEIWDPDNDGLFEAGRTARMPIPEFLMPLRPPRPVVVDSSGTPLDSAAADSVLALRDSLAMRADSLSREAARVRAFRFPPTIFWDTTAGPLRFWRAMQQPQRQAPQTPEVPQRRTEPPMIGRPIPPRVQTQPETGLRLLGVPVDSVRRPRPDTMRRDTSALRPRL